MRVLNTISFEEWVHCIFELALDEPIIQIEQFDTKTHPVIVVEYLTRLFEDAQSILASYSPMQLYWGLWHIVSWNSDLETSYGDVLKNEQVPWADRKRCFDAMYTLFETFFASRCTPHLVSARYPGHTLNLVNDVCFMWWDCIWYAALIPPKSWLTTRELEGTKQGDLNHATMDVLVRILSLESDPCRESALHGLAHHHHFYEERVVNIINEFLAQNTQIRPELRAYALQARDGKGL